MALGSERFDVAVSYRLQDGVERLGHGVILSDDTASFWFFDPANLEILVKVLDGRPVNGHHWVFFGSLSDLDYTVSITDRLTGVTRDYASVPGQPTSLADTQAFSDVAQKPRSWSVDPEARGLQTLTQAHLEETDPNAFGAASQRHVHCEGGEAAGYPCESVDLEALLTLEELGADSDGSVSASDLWGWTDPRTGREYALVGLSNATAFVDVTESGEPLFLGQLPSRTRSSPWRDIKTYGNYAFIVADSSPGHGLQVFDLRRLRGVTTPQSWDEDTTYREFGTAHNIAIDTIAGMAFAVGSDTCAGGLHMISVRNPLNPTFAGCFEDDGYTHDAQCVQYTGPDAEFFERHLCFAANEDSLTIVDVTDPSAPEQISRTDYQGRSYAHQAWLTPSQRHLLLDDETDERANGHGTRTYIWDVTSLRSPRVIGAHTANTAATDHNQYTARGHVFQANYRAGLRVLDLNRVAQGRLREVGYFDVEPADDEPRFNGAWSTYPYFDSGKVIVSDTGRGLFVLNPLIDGFGVPEAPVNLSAEIVNFQVLLRWQNACHHATAFRVYRQRAGGPRLLLAELEAGTNEFIDPDLFSLSEITYEVVAVLNGQESEPVRTTLTAPEVPSSCTPSGGALCLSNGRFQVTVRWRTPSGDEGTGGSLPLTGDTGGFWYFDPANYELVVKVLDGRIINGSFWVFLGGLSDVAYDVTLVDTATGTVRTYSNPAGTLSSLADTSAFREPTSP
ncbi:MAG: choice-of-anchor B family protein [Acidobacteriota bacterium]